MDQIRLLIVDDHMVVRKGIQLLLKIIPTIRVVGEAENGQKALHQIANLQPDIVLLDLVMPGEDGAEIIREIKCNFPMVKIIVLTAFNDEIRITAALQAGTDGYLLKDVDGHVLLDAIRTVQQGGKFFHPEIVNHLINGIVKNTEPNKIDSLTEREKEVLQLVAKGWSNREVAQALSLSDGTIRVYVTHIINKLNVSSRTEAAIRAVQMGLISSE